MPRNELSPFEKKTRHEIAENLKKHMHGMTQTRLAIKASLPLTTLSGYIREESTPNADNLEKLAKALKVKKSDIDPRYGLINMGELSGTRIYQRIKHAAAIRKISIKKLAEKVGFKSPSTIYNYQYGKSIPSETSLRAIARALSVNPDYLRGTTNDWNPHIDSEGLQEDRITDEAEAKVLTMFRKSTKGMNEAEKLRFQQSLEKLINAAKDLNNPKE